MLRDLLAVVLHVGPNPSAVLVVLLLGDLGCDGLEERLQFLTVQLLHLVEALGHEAVRLLVRYALAKALHVGLHLAEHLHGQVFVHVLGVGNERPAGRLLLDGLHGPIEGDGLDPGGLLGLLGLRLLGSALSLGLLLGGLGVSHLLEALGKLANARVLGWCASLVGVGVRLGECLPVLQVLDVAALADQLGRVLGELLQLCVLGLHLGEEFLLLGVGLGDGLTRLDLGLEVGQLGLEFAVLLADRGQRAQGGRI